MKGKYTGIVFNLRYDDLIDGNAVIEEGDYTFVLENLLSNAVAAIQSSDKKIIDTVITSDRRRIFVEVQDTGCGIPEKKWEAIFLETDGEKGSF